MEHQLYPVAVFTYHNAYATLDGTGENQLIIVQKILTWNVFHVLWIHLDQPAPSEKKGAPCAHKTKPHTAEEMQLHVLVNLGS
jgi:hypothetical protein